MAINFPDSPVANVTTYTYGTKTWIFTGQAWKLQTSNVTAPLAVSEGGTGADSAANAILTLGVDTYVGEAIGNVTSTLSNNITTGNLTSNLTFTGFVLYPLSISSNITIPENVIGLRPGPANIENNVFLTIGSGSTIRLI